MQAVEDRHYDTVIAALDEDFRAGKGIDKTVASEVIKRYLSKPFINNNLVRELHVKQHDDSRGEVFFTVISFMDPQSPYYFTQTVTTQW